MAIGLRDSQPGMKVRINPPGHRKVSDTIWLVAEPLLESAPNYAYLFSLNSEVAATTERRPPRLLRELGLVLMFATIKK